jgi:hypothetical protein
MTEHGNGKQRYTFVLLANVIADLKQFHAELMPKGEGEDYLQVLARIDERLRSSPREFGEPVYRLPALSLQVYQAVLRPVAITYGVHDKLPIVFVRVAPLLT